MHLAHIDSFLRENLLSPSENLLNLASTLIPLTLNRTPLLIYGPPARKKTLMIKMLANIYAKSKNIDFNLNIIKLDAVSPEALLGSNNKSKSIDCYFLYLLACLFAIRLSDDCSFSEGIFKRGLIEMMVEAMKCTDQTEEEKEIRDVQFDFETSFCNQRIKGKVAEVNKATLKPTELLILNKKKTVVAPI